MASWTASSTSARQPRTRIADARIAAAVATGRFHATSDAGALDAADAVIIDTSALTAAEAIDLWQQFQLLEDAGAFAVECELIPAAVMAQIHRRTSMATISLGSGADADVMFLFSADICGESARTPRHARVYGNVGALQQQIADERVRALSAFRADVAARVFPNEAELGNIPPVELAGFLAALDNG